MAGDVNWGSVAALMHFDGVNTSKATIDSGPKALTVVANGNAQISTAQSVFGGSSLYLDGTAAATVQFPDVSDFTPSGKDWTLELRVRYLSTTLSTTGYCILAKRSGTTGENEYRLIFNSTGTLNFLLWQTDGSTTCVSLTSTTAIARDTWAAVAITRQGTTWRLFVNGVLEATAAEVGTPNTIGRSLYLGRDVPAIPDRNFFGYIDEFRVTAGVARYTATYTVATAAFPDGAGQVSGTVKDSAGAAVARMLRAFRRSDGVIVADTYTGPGDTYFNDVSLHLTGDGADGAQKCVDRAVLPNTITFAGDAKISASRKRYANSSFRFDGTGDYLSIPSSPKFSGNGQAFTVELHVYPEILSSTRHLIGKRGAANSEWLLVTTATGTMQLTVFTASLAVTAQINTATALTLNAWNYVAVTRDASGTWRVFLNGVLDGSAAESAGAVQTNSSALVIGRDDAVPGTRDFQGNMEGIRITSGFARYTATFTPPGDRHPLRASGALGDYSFPTPTLDELDIVYLDDDAGTLFNDIVHRVIPA